MAQIRTVFFDLDDTITRWQDAHLAAIRNAIEAVANAHRDIDSGLITTRIIAITSEAVPEMNMGSTSFADISMLLAKELGFLGVDEAVSHGVINIYAQSVLRSIRAWDDCVILKKISPIYALGIITNGPSEWQLAKLAQLGLDKMFDAVICSSDYGVCKPDRKLFAEACRKAKVEPANSAMVGNNFFKDAVGASDAGMYGIWLNRDNLPLPVADWNGPVIGSLTELPDILSRIESMA